MHTKQCLFCNYTFQTKDNRKKFCNNSCSASYTNCRKPKKEVGNCPICEKPVTRKTIYCSNNCHIIASKREKISKLISGENVKFDIRTIKFLLIDIYGHVCVCCGNNEWLGNPIPLEVHHIDGDAYNNIIANLELRCPNCHSLTDNYKKKNKNATRIR